MIGFLKGLFGGKDKDEAASADSIEYKGHIIRPTPMKAGAQYQTAGVIEKEFDGTMKTYRFVRVDKHTSREDAVALIIIKGQQIIDEQGDRIYAEPR